MKRILPTSLLLLALIILTFIFIKPRTLVHSAANHIVISEVQIIGDDVDDEFVELYNPTSDPVDLTGWRLTKKNAGGTQSNLISSFDESIPAFGYYLIAKNEYDGSVTPDRFYSASSSAITANNTIILYSDSGTTVVDKVGFGSNVADFETATYSANPAANGSIERKALASSTDITMAFGGEDEIKGNSDDTDNNDADFVTQSASNPQNSSMSENPNPPTPTQIPSPTPIESGPTPPLCSKFILFRILLSSLHSIHISILPDLILHSKLIWLFSGWILFRKQLLQSAVISVSICKIT